MPFAIAAPVLLAGVGAASDMAVFSLKQSELQSVADAAAIAAANELALGKTSPSVLQATSDAFVSAAIHDANRYVVSEAAMGANTASVTVTVTENWTPFFAHFVGVSVTPVVQKATASLAGSSNICVLALNGSAASSFQAKPASDVSAKNCSIIVNSNSPTSIDIGAKATVTSEQLCTAGGVDNSGFANAAPTTDCPTVSDPLALRAEPKAGSCDYNNFYIDTGSAVLNPGTFCGGIEITGTANVTFDVSGISAPALAAIEKVGGSLKAV